MIDTPTLEQELRTFLLARIKPADMMLPAGDLKFTHIIKPNGLERRVGFIVAGEHLAFSYKLEGRTPATVTVGAILQRDELTPGAQAPSDDALSALAMKLLVVNR